MTALSLPELFERRHKVAAELATLDRLIEAEALRLTEEAKRQQPIKSSKLAFERNKVCWENGEIRLTGKSYRFIQVLWQAKKRRLETNALCQMVFGSSTILNETLRKFISRLSKKLKTGHFPFFLKPIPNGKTREIMGYGLRRDIWDKK